MDTMQKYPIRFYGKTWQYWLAALFVVFPAVGICCLTAIMMLLGAIGIVRDVKSFGDNDVIYGVIIFAFFILLAIALTFRLCALQRPILKIHKEGLWIRTIMTSDQINPYLGCLLGFFLTSLLRAFTMVLQVITLQLFRIRLVRLRWENIDVVVNMRTLEIKGMIDKDEDDFGQETTREHHASIFGTDSFGTSFAAVTESVQFYLHNPDSREMLPSWQEEDIVSDRFAVYND